MRRLIFMDAHGGVAGDMFVAALLDCLPRLRDRVFSDVMAVLPADLGSPAIEEGVSSGIRARRFFLEPAPAGRRDKPGKTAKKGPGDQAQTDYPSLKRRIGEAELADGTAEAALGILAILAEAEARIHGVTTDEVHFHEIGDWDSLMDVVAAGSIAGGLDGYRWAVSSLPRGSGTVKTAHGLLPVPAPATILILEGFDWHDDGIAGERVTPTGAAIVRYLCRDSSATRGPLGKLTASGTGAGTREFPGIANIFRASIYDADEPAGEESIVVVSFDVDDMTGEEIGTSCDFLRETPGVVDVSVSSGAGKKGRLMHLFRILVSPAHLEEAIQACFVQTSTIGLRWRREQRRTLAREHGQDNGVRIKTVARPDRNKTTKAENDDLTRFGTLKERRRAARRSEGGGDRD